MPRPAAGPNSAWGFLVFETINVDLDKTTLKSTSDFFPIGLVRPGSSLPDASYISVCSSVKVDTLRVK